MNDHMGIEIAVPGQQKVVVPAKQNPNEKRVRKLTFSQIDLVGMNHSNFIKIIPM